MMTPKIFLPVGLLILSLAAACGKPEAPVAVPPPKPSVPPEPEAAGQIGQDGSTSFFASLAEVVLTVDITDLGIAGKPILGTAKWVLNPRVDVRLANPLEDPGKEHRRPVFGVTVVLRLDAETKAVESPETEAAFTMSQNYTIERGEQGKHYVCQDRVVRRVFESPPEQLLSSGLDAVRLDSWSVYSRLVRESKDAYRKSAPSK